MISEDKIIRQRQKESRHEHCEFQRPCWKNVRAPIARKNKIYLPYICSYQTEGDLEKCGWRDKFLEGKEKGELIINGEV